MVLSSLLKIRHHSSLNQTLEDNKAYRLLHFSEVNISLIEDNGLVVKPQTQCQGTLVTIHYTYRLWQAILLILS